MTATTCCGQFGSATATRSPGPTPSLVSAAAARPTCSLSWPYVSVLPMNQVAVLFGCMATAWLNQLTRVSVPMVGLGSVHSA